MVSIACSTKVAKSSKEKNGSSEVICASSDEVGNSIGSSAAALHTSACRASALIDPFCWPTKSSEATLASEWRCHSISGCQRRAPRWRDDIAHRLVANRYGRVEQRMSYHTISGSY